MVYTDGYLRYVKKCVIRVYPNGVGGRMKICINLGYGRVSDVSQKSARQITAILRSKYDIKPENIFIDKQTGKTFVREKYDTMKALIVNIVNAYGDSPDRPEINVIIEELDRLGRNKKGILEELRWFESMHVRVRILEIPTTLIDIDKENDWVIDMVNKILIEVYASLAEQELNKKEKRQREGIAEARKNGVYKGRKPIEVDMLTFELIYKRWKSGELTARKAMELLNLKSQTFYRRVKQYEESISA